jgi:hypothetical protein
MSSQPTHLGCYKSAFQPHRQPKRAERESGDEERRKIYVSAESGDTAHDAAVENAEFGEVKAQWADPIVSYSTAKTCEIEKPPCVDVAV